MFFGIEFVWLKILTFWIEFSLLVRFVNGSLEWCMDCFDWMLFSVFFSFRSGFIELFVKLMGDDNEKWGKRCEFMLVFWKFELKEFVNDLKDNDWFWYSLFVSLCFGFFFLGGFVIDFFFGGRFLFGLRGVGILEVRLVILLLLLSEEFVLLLEGEFFSNLDNIGFFGIEGGFGSGEFWFNNVINRGLLLGISSFNFLEFFIMGGGSIVFCVVLGGISSYFCGIFAFGNIMFFGFDIFLLFIVGR